MHSAMWTRTLPYFKKPLGNNERVGWSDKELKLWIFCSNVTPKRSEQKKKTKKRKISMEPFRSLIQCLEWCLLGCGGIGPKARTNPSHDGNNEILLINKIHNVKHRLAGFFSQQIHDVRLVATVLKTQTHHFRWLAKWPGHIAAIVVTISGASSFSNLL